MSKSTVIGIVTAVCVVSFLLGLYLVPSLYAKNAGKDAAQKAAPSVISQAIQPVVKEEAQKTAREIAATIVAEPHDSAIDIQHPSKPESSAAPVVVHRADFEITLPAGSTLKPEDPKYGANRLVECRLAGNAALDIIFVDEKANAASIAENALDGVRGAMKDPTTNHESALGWMSVVGVNGIEGSIGGELVACETGYRPGTDKACVIIIEYPMNSDKKQTAIDSIQQAISTLSLKE